MVLNEAQTLVMCCTQYKKKRKFRGKVSGKKKASLRDLCSPGPGGGQGQVDLIHFVRQPQENSTEQFTNYRSNNQPGAENKSLSLASISPLKHSVWLKVDQRKT